MTDWLVQLKKRLTIIHELAKRINEQRVDRDKAETWGNSWSKNYEENQKQIGRWKIISNLSNDLSTLTLKVVQMRLIDLVFLVLVKISISLTIFTSIPSICSVRFHSNGNFATAPPPELCCASRWLYHRQTGDIHDEKILVCVRRGKCSAYNVMHIWLLVMLTLI